jgi:hypothetical protein
VSRDVTSVRGTAYAQCIRTVHDVKPGEGPELKRVYARNREDPYRVQRLEAILVGGGPCPFQPSHSAMLGTANSHREERTPMQKGKEGREELLDCCVCQAVLAS